MSSLYLKEIVAIKHFHNIFATSCFDCIGNVGRGWSWWELYKTEIGFTVKSSFYFCSKQKLHTLTTIFITNAFFHWSTIPNKYKITIWWKNISGDRIHLRPNGFGIALQPQNGWDLLEYGQQQVTFPEYMKYAQFRGWVRHFIRFSKWLPIFQ